MSRTPTSSLAKVLRSILPALVSIFCLLVLWATVKVVGQYPRYILPGPAEVWHAFWTHRSETLWATLTTMLAAIGGMSLSVVAGSLIAVLFSQASWIRRGFYPLAIFLQTVPIVAIAPIIVLWLQEGLVATMFVSFVVSLFPVITNTTTGLLDVDNGHFDLFRMYHASRWQRLIRLQIPGALPGFVTGLKVASGMSVLGAVVGEFFCATIQNKGLGRLIFELKDYDAAWMYSCIFLATMLGVAAFALVSLFGDRVLLYWDEKQISHL